VLYAPGINCHEETAFSVDYAGGQGEIVLLADLLEGKGRLDDYAGLVIPGGFSYGDHLAAGRVLAIHLIARLKEELRAFTASGRPVPSSVVILLTTYCRQVAPRWRPSWNGRMGARLYS